VQIDALGTRTDGLDPIISIYLSGSAVNYDPTDYFNQELPVTLGKRIGELRVTTDNQRFDDTVFSFESDNTGTATLLFVIESGTWQVADVHVTTDNDPGYSPNYTRIKTLVPTPHKSDNQISFRVEYYNVAGVKSKQINYLYSKNWQGGNRYIDGDYSMLTGSLYVADSLESGIAISGYKDTGFVRSLGYEGFAAGFPGFLIWSGSALSGSAGTKGGIPYSGVGLELYGNANNYFRYSTNPSELDVHTETFFFGDPTSQYISGSNGNLEISSSGFYLTANGDVTASSFIAVNGSDVLFDSNSEFVDGVNVGRVIYFDQTEYTYDIATLPITASGITGSVFAGPSFQAFILPGETRIQVSYTFQADRTDAVVGDRTYRLTAFIANAVSGSNVGLTSYGIFTNSSTIQPAGLTISTVPTTGKRSGANTQGFVDTGDVISDRQGMYVLIHTMIHVSSAGTTGTLKLKNFVFRSSRTVGAITSTPSIPIR
jgi:hypothetical protein